MTRNGWQFWIDRGGTFTDCIGRSPAGELKIAKLLSSDEAPVQGIRQILSIAEHAHIPACEVKMGTTVATNALLERKGARHALLITKGFADALEIGTQARPELFEYRIVKPSVLYGTVIEIDERLAADGTVLRPPDPATVMEQLRVLHTQGYDNIAVVLLHGYAFPQHEILIAQLARDLGFQHISCSHEVCPEIGFTARGDTTTADAYLTPIVHRYLQQLRHELTGSNLTMMQSSGGLIDAAMFRGHNAIISGPAAGVVAGAAIGRHLGFDKIIGFDMGGTSTDVSRFDGQFERVYETVTAGVRLKAPMLHVHTVAAGGGSVCKIVAGRLTVGPESAGSVPGPLCYGLTNDQGDFKADELTITDVNFFLGRILPDNFPFALHRSRVASKLDDMAAELRTISSDQAPIQIAEGYLHLANLIMAQAIKEISVARGRDVREYVLCCFGGAGGQHACAIARQLGIKKILLHPYAGILSAYGMGLADAVWEDSAPVSRLRLNDDALLQLQQRFDSLEQTGREIMAQNGYAPADVAVQRKLDLRYRGTETSLTIAEPEDGDYDAAFTAEHQKLYGYIRADRWVEVLQCRVEVIGKTPKVLSQPRPVKPYSPEAGRRVPIAFNQCALSTPVFWRHELSPGAVILGPALILEDIGTIVVEPDFTARMDGANNIILERHAEDSGRQQFTSSQADPVGLEVFNYLFMSIAEQMGSVLRRTAVSTNIKERLDFSCAVFDREGRLVANAPHIPVHLGAMGETVRAIRAAHPVMRPGDVFVSNHPARGGSHLPDITVMTPVFVNELQPVFFTASRAHHADVGGITPGSMPPFSRSLAEEGVLIDQLRLVQQGVFDEAAFEKLFRSGPYPARNLADNRADLQAQIAANHNGAKLLQELCERYSTAMVLAYMQYVRDNAADQVRQALRDIPDGTYTFTDHMDDGKKIVVSINVQGEHATINFAGTAPESDDNLNAPRAVVMAATLYVFRCLVAERIPLNEGCLLPLTVIIPPGCFLNPSAGRAVAGGNVETSQRIVDVLFGALGLAAASQGTMNNLTFGDETFGYYETIAGGVGAAAGYHGASGVHAHMTNTRITDPEVLETRHPVRLKRFGLRQDSGGDGKFRGGDGVIRHFEFLKPLAVSLLTQRRTSSPYGMAGGEAGKPGENLRIKQDGQKTILRGSDAYTAEAGEELIIQTPGGGGWGKKHR